MMQLIVKTVLVILVLALCVQQASMFYSIVILGPYLQVAPSHLQMITGLIWPLLIIFIPISLITKILKFKISDLD